MNRPMLILLGALALLIVSLMGVGAQNPVPISSIPSHFEGNILAISDADMVASAYGDGKLGQVVGIRDTLTLIENRNGKLKGLSKLHVSNSVMGWPAILAWDQDLAYAYVVETGAEIHDTLQQVENVYTDFPLGRKLSVVDYQQAQTPKLIQVVEFGKGLQGIDINQRGTLLVGGSSEKGKEIVVGTLKEGLIDRIFTFTESQIDYSLGRDGGIKSVKFHPTQNVIGVNLNNNSVVFYRIVEENAGIDLIKVGESLESLCTRCSVGNWHPSGDFFFISDVNWSGSKLGYAFNRKGKLISIRFDEKGHHEIASQIKVGLSPEGFDISPDGKYAAVVNMNRTYLPKKFRFIPKSKISSLSLLKIDPSSGKLTPLGKPYAFEGALPEDAIFDQESNSIAVAVYHTLYDMQPKEGWIDFWEIQNDTLYKTQRTQPLTRGVHSLLTIK